jgi:hypothetical protein
LQVKPQAALANPQRKPDGRGSPAKLPGNTASVVFGLRDADQSPGQQETTMDSERVSREHQKAQVNVHDDLGFGGAPPGTRTPNPLVKSRTRGVSGGAE